MWDSNSETENRREETERGESRAEPELLQHLEVCLGKRNKGERGGSSEMKEGESVLEAEEEKKERRDKKRKSIKGKRIGNRV